ncbi:hypothetical protein PIB30_098726 [Stylosanthes scabra]|uniref:Uncharacterized protein n=1 Tax=Stylosanthes scabra TaxID=79078 RepID=A0ABU6YUA1_9FABA|nr:hypothetical protein [Stylosanthes scabra]
METPARDVRSRAMVIAGVTRATDSEDHRQWLGFSSLVYGMEIWVSLLISKGNRRDKPTIEFDPEIEKTLKKNRSRVKAQRALQFDQEEVNFEEGASDKSFEEELVEENIEEEIQDNMADNANNQRRTLADYTNPTTTSCGSSIVWPTVDANNFELKPALVQLVQ